LKTKTLGIMLFLLGFILAVPLAYTVATLNYEQIVRLVKAIIILGLITLGVLLGSTGLVLLIYKRG